MKKSTLNIIIALASLIAIGATVWAVFSWQNQPHQIMENTFGVDIPSGVTITKFEDENSWDGRLYYGTLTVDKDNLQGIVNTKNFSPLKDSTDSRVTKLIEDVNQSFSISLASVNSPDIQYQRFTITGDSLLVIFYNSDTQEYFFYATRY